MRRARRIGVAVLGVAFVLVIAAGVAYALDDHAHDGRVARRVSLAGRDVSGLRPPEVAAAVAELSRRYPTTTIDVDGDGAGFRATAADFGLSVDQQATAHAVM